MSNTKAGRYNFGNGKFGWYFWFIQKKPHSKTNWKYLIHFLIEVSSIELFNSAESNEPTARITVTALNTYLASHIRYQK